MRNLALPWAPMVNNTTTADTVIMEAGEVTITKIERPTFPRVAFRVVRTVAGRQIKRTYCPTFEEALDYFQAYQER